MYKTITFNGKTITVLSAQVNLACHQLNVTIDDESLTDSEVMCLLNVELDAIGFPCHEITSPVPTPRFSLNSRWLFGLAGVVSGLALLLLPWIVGPLSLVAMTVIGIPSVALTLVLGAESYMKAGKLLLNGGHLHMDTLFAISTLTALAASVVALFVPGLPMMFEAGLLIFGFRHIGEAIRESLEHRMALTARFQDRAPQSVNTLYDNEVKRLPIDEIAVGDLVLLRAGDVAPVDGICESGAGVLNRSIEFGSQDPVPLKPGEPLSAGTILVSGEVQMRVMAVARASLLARKDASIAASLSAKDETSWKTQADKALRYFIPMVFGLALLSGLVVGCFFPLSIAIQSVVAVLVSACPCTLGLVTGLVVRVGMKKAADHHIDFKSTRKLEEVDAVSHVVFDLNGTLTTSVPEVVELVHVTDTGCTYEDCLTYVLMLERESTKAVGMALFQYASQKLSHSLPYQHAAVLDGSHHAGVKATIQDATYMIGNQEMMRDNHIPIDAYSHRVLASDETIMYLVRDQTILSHFILKRPLRPEAKHVVRALNDMGKQVHILTGADEDTATSYARELGIPLAHVRFKMTSAEKVNCINAIKTNPQHRVAMIGDEENDADAIAASDFGVAMPTDGRRNMSRHVADAESRVSSLEPVVAAFEVSRQTGMTIQHNLMFSWSYNIAALLLPVALLLTTGIALSPGVGVALMILQTSLILLNTYWFKQQDLVYLTKAKQGDVVAEHSSYDAITTLLPTLDSQTLSPAAIASPSVAEPQPSESGIVLTNTPDLAFSCYETCAIDSP